MRLILCCLIACSFTGCGLSARQAQNLSDGLAGIEAAQPRVAADPVASAALAGAHDHVEATAEGESLPLPKRTPAAIIADPASYADDASKAVDEARSIGSVVGMGARCPGCRPRRRPHDPRSRRCPRRSRLAGACPKGHAPGRHHPGDPCHGFPVAGPSHRTITEHRRHQHAQGAGDDQGSIGSQRCDS